MWKKRAENKFSVTVCGEFFPESYPGFRSSRWSRGEEDPLTTEMRLFSSCMRWAFNRLLEGVSRDEVKKRGQELFGLNSRYTDDAWQKAQAVLDSRRKLLETQIKETEARLGRARKKLALAMSSLSVAEKNGAALDVLERLRLAVKGRGSRVASLEKRLAELKVHQENGTIPEVVFGGRELWRKVCEGRKGLHEWRVARKCRLYAGGDETKGGNPNMKVSYQDEDFRLAVTISHLSEQVGEDAFGRPKMSRAPRVEGRLWLPEKYRDLVRVWLSMKLPYTVELIGTPDCRLLVHLTFSLAGAPEPDFKEGCLGLDINPDGVALCNLGRTGQPEPWPEDFSVPYPPNLDKYRGEFQVTTYPNGFAYIRIPDLEYARSFRRKYLIGVLAKVIIDVAEFLEKPVAIENLKFSKNRLDTNPQFNRMASNFPYASMVEAVCRRATKGRIGFRHVPPQHTSTIGYWKYMNRFAVPVHCAAALVVGRRAMGYQERTTRELKQLLDQIKQNLSPKVSSLPREGEGMTRRARACLKRLERKVKVHNGLTLWQQEAFHSAWHDFKKLAAALWRLRLAGIGQTGRCPNRTREAGLKPPPEGPHSPAVPFRRSTPVRVRLPGRGPLSPCPLWGKSNIREEVNAWSGGRLDWKQSSF